MLMATAVSVFGVMAINSLCCAMLQAVVDIPQSRQTPQIDHSLSADGNNAAKQMVIMTAMEPMKRNGPRPYKRAKT